jgi:hypothetical protein
MNRVSETHVSFWRWCSLVESPVFTTIKLGEHVEVTVTSDDYDDPVSKVTRKHADPCRDCEPDCCLSGCSFELTGSLTIRTGGPTEEGYYSSVERYEFDGEVLRRTIATDGRDCDGRMEHYDEDLCVELDGMVPYYHSDEPDPGVRVPSWESVERRQRDHTAESMGY